MMDRREPSGLVDQIKRRVLRAVEALSEGRSDA